MGTPSPQQLVIILLIIVLLFGAKKIPELAKGLGSGIKNFKKALKEDEDGQTNDDIAESQIEQTSPRTKNTKATKTTRKTKVK